jgi:putative SOS response-associated peptidase YedK
MCNLYSRTRNVKTIRRLFRVPHNRSRGASCSCRMAGPRRVTHVRDDKILTSRFWKPSFEQRRCLVPASSYCEPDSEKPAQWHGFAVNGDEDRRLFAFAGIWRRWIGPVK